MTPNQWGISNSTRLLQQIREFARTCYAILPLSLDKCHPLYNPLWQLSHVWYLVFSFCFFSLNIDLSVNVSFVDTSPYPIKISMIVGCTCLPNTSNQSSQNSRTRTLINLFQEKITKHFLIISTCILLQWWFQDKTNRNLEGSFPFTQLFHKKGYSFIFTFPPYKRNYIYFCFWSLVYGLPITKKYFFFYQVQFLL